MFTVSRPLPLVLRLVLHPIMAQLDLNDPIDWDALDEFDGEARELAGDFFFEVDSDEGKSCSSSSILSSGDSLIPFSQLHIF